MTNAETAAALLINKYQTCEGNAAAIGNEAARSHFRRKWRALQAAWFPHSVRGY